MPGGSKHRRKKTIDNFVEKIRQYHKEEIDFLNKILNMTNEIINPKVTFTGDMEEMEKEALDSGKSTANSIKLTLSALSDCMSATLTQMDNFVQALEKIDE